MPEWLYRGVLAILLPFGAIAIVAPDVIANIFSGQIGILEIIRSPSGIRHTMIAAVAFLPLTQLHEETHRLAATMLQLKPTRRLRYVLIQETWVSQRKRVLMSAAPVITIQPAALLVAIFGSGLFEQIAVVVFVSNASLIAKDVYDILFGLVLPEDAYFWSSDLGEQPIEFFAIPCAQIDSSEA